MARKVARSTTTLSGVGTSYSSPVQVEMKVSPTGAVYVGSVSIVNVQASNLSASPKPTKMTLKISERSAGDQYLVTSTESEIEYGETTASNGTAIWRVDGVLALDEDLNDEFFCWVKTDKGTMDIDRITITWIGDR
tara:strand:+ start:817 stop:1224 length:408 start_codon:yes stop_codon:yes gene_type:complete